MKDKTNYLPSKNIKEQHVLKSLENYLAEKYMFQDDYSNNVPYKIMEHKIINNKVQQGGYSYEFIKWFYSHREENLTHRQIKMAIQKLYYKHYKLYDALKIIWGKPIECFSCHLSTTYRRLKQALKFIAKETGLLQTDP